jgi:hypothetical protein
MPPSGNGVTFTEAGARRALGKNADRWSIGGLDR